MLFISMGMYVSLLGLLFYDVLKYHQTHLGFVFALIIFGYAFSNYVIFFGVDGSSINSRDHIWRFMASVGYNILGTVFFLFFMLNAYAKRKIHCDFHTIQSLFEIAWVLSLVFMLYVYACSSL